MLFKYDLSYIGEDFQECLDDYTSMIKKLMVEGMIQVKKNANIYISTHFKQETYRSWKEHVELAKTLMDNFLARSKQYTNVSIDEI